MGDDKDTKRKLSDVALSPINITNKRRSLLLLSDSESDNSSDIDESLDSYICNDLMELVEIDQEIKTLQDLINLGKQFDRTKRYEFNMYKLNKMVPSMEKINNFIGMTSIKDHLVDHILFYLQSENFKVIDKDIMHTVITGPPGVGKTEFAKALGELYLSMGILSNNKFVKVTRADLVAKYLGQTAIKTKEKIESCKGGVMFIDEVYSLGNRELRDSFAKEAIDTLNEHLTVMKDNFICIVAGYKEEVENCFFAYNKGLHSRFPIRFEIEGYNYKELFQIFKQKVEKSLWKLDERIDENFFKNIMKNLKYFGRDIENLLTQIKRSHSRRVFTKKLEEKTLITQEDMKNGLNQFLSFNKKDKKEDKPPLNMYI
jgi:SpoVK/Ycf46/Vps4 family AAA+-type ATPase